MDITERKKFMSRNYEKKASEYEKESDWNIKGRKQVIRESRKIEEYKII